MFKHTAGQKVGSGTYWNLLTGHRIDLDQEGILPGADGATYLKTPAGAILFLGPLFGLAYVLAMPVIGVVTILALVVQRTLEAPFSLAKNIISFGWRPTEAYLGGKNKKKDNNAPTRKQKDR